MKKKLLAVFAALGLTLAVLGATAAPADAHATWSTNGACGTAVSTYMEGPPPGSWLTASLVEIHPCRSIAQAWMGFWDNSISDVQTACIQVTYLASNNTLKLGNYDCRSIPVGGTYNNVLSSGPTPYSGTLVYINIQTWSASGGYRSATVYTPTG